MTTSALPTLADDKLRQAIALVGRNDIDDEQLEDEMRALAGEPMLSRRLIDWLPEIFALVLIPRVGNIKLPTTFSAKKATGRWIEFEFAKEPLFEPALRIAAQMYQDGPRETFSNIARQSGLVAAVNQVLHAKKSLDGGVLSGPALIGIPAEIYLPASTSWWKRIFG